jgi:pyruvate/2-oxoglutarate dehydrogenase complex dihydrolipoamide acyltransferase (E2) component
MMSEFRLPELERSETVCISCWLKRPGETVGQHEKLVEVFSEQFDWDIPAPEAGVLTEIVAAEGVSVRAGEVLALIEGTAQVPSKPAALPTARTVRVSPLAAKIAADQQIDLLKAHGSGPAGRVNKEDVLALLQSEPGQSRLPVDQPGAQPGYEPPDSPSARPPCATTFFAVDMTNVAAQRANWEAHWLQREGFTLDYLPFVVRAVVAALRSVPLFNGTFTSEGAAQDSGINVEVVQAGGNTLLPCVEAYNLVGTARRLRAAGTMAANSQQQPFRIEDHSAGGALLATGLLAQGAVAMLSVGVVQKQAVAMGDALQVRPMAYLGLTYDPRVAGEARAGQFTAELKRLLEEVSFS